ncbi:hypothetical protein L9F63_013380 [Diploptera punctata]|uniref:Uncharacterized protein n=1 Tax=Diploptera punctata TaxID=6984 RepID=A0AAD8EMC0_DIPPU|nr:hypothetical protein L9F63_013380 [Diploptera punctata]
MKTSDIRIYLVLLLRCQVQAIQRKLHSRVLPAYDQDWNYVRLINKNEFYLNAVDSDGKSLPMMAAESGQWDMVHRLREKGADINLRDNLQRSVLHIASFHRRWDDIKMLITNGSNINAVDRLGRSATIIAVSYKEWDIVQWLIEQGADLNSRDGYGRSILLLAASQNNWRFVKWLLSKGADPKIADQSRRTLLHLAAMADNLDVVQILVEEFHVDFNEEDRAGNTAINMAAISNDPTSSVYKYLVYKRDKVTEKFRRVKLVFTNAEFFRLSFYIIEEIKSKELIDTLYNLTYDVDDQIKGLNEDLVALDDYKEDLEDFYKKKTIALGVGIAGAVVGAVANICVPGAAAVGAAVSTAAGIASATFSRPDFPKLNIDKYGDYAGFVIEVALEDVNKVIGEIRIFQEKVSKINKNFEKYGIRKNVLTTIEKLESADTNEYILNEVDVHANKLFDESERKVRIINSKKRSYGVSEEEKDNIIQVTMEVKVIVELITTGVKEILELRKQSDDDMENIAKIRKIVEIRIRQLKKFKDKIKTDMLPVITNMKKDIEKAQDAIAKMTNVRLSLENWRVDSALRNAQVYLSMMTEGFEEKKNILICSDQ